MRAQIDAQALGPSIDLTTLLPEESGNAAHVALKVGGDATQLLGIRSDRGSYVQIDRGLDRCRRGRCVALTRREEGGEGRWQMRSFDPPLPACREPLHQLSELANIEGPVVHEQSFRSVGRERARNPWAGASNHERKREREDIV